MLQKALKTIEKTFPKQEAACSMEYNISIFNVL